MATSGDDAYLPTLMVDADLSCQDALVKLRDAPDVAAQVVVTADARPIGVVDEEALSKAPDPAAPVRERVAHQPDPLVATDADSLKKALVSRERVEAGRYVVLDRGDGMATVAHPEIVLPTGVGGGKSGGLGHAGMHTVELGRLPGSPTSVSVYFCDRDAAYKVVTHYDPTNPPRCPNGHRMRRLPRK